MATVIVRDSRVEDVDAIQQIYAFHVLNGTGTFEEIPPDVQEMRNRRDGVLTRSFPFLVAEKDGDILGYAYADHFNTRSGWRFTITDSVYVRHDVARQGVGRLLMHELLDRCKSKGVKNIIAAIGDSQNAGSINLHKALGFECQGVLPNVGFKFGRWLDCLYYVKVLEQPENCQCSNPPLS
eukprot:GILK01010852.1.p1 GENE.GILK01010852.1~~GILK01010852.1.p1  ORF type:complete len:195 (-),score=14.94 GILK01010852.1:28-570(-)